MFTTLSQLSPFHSSITIPFHHHSSPVYHPSPPPTPSSPGNPHNIVHVHELFFFLFISFHAVPPSHQHSPTLSSCPRVIHMSSLASPFPILFLNPYLFCTYHLCFLFPVPFPPFSTAPPPALPPVDNPPCELHFCDSVSVLVGCLVCFWFCFRFNCW